MKLLFRTAFKNGKYRALLALTLVSMCLLTFASQLEIFALGVITKKGPDVFELFAPLQNDHLQKVEQITLADVQNRWPEIAGNANASLSKPEAAEFLAKWKNRDFVDQLVTQLNAIFPVSDNLKNLALFIVFIALFKAITLFIHRFTTRVVAIKVSRDLRQAYFEHIQGLPMEFFQKFNSGSISSRVMGDAALVAEAVNACLINYIQTPFTVLTTLTLCCLTSWKLSLIIFIGFPCILFPIAFLAKKVKKISKQIQKNQEHFSSVLIDFLAGIQTVKVFAMEDFSLTKYKEQNQRMAHLEQRSARYDLSSRPVVHTIAMLFLGGSLLYGLYVLRMSVSEVFFYCGLLYVFYEPIKKFAEENSHIQRGISAAERMWEVMDLKPDHDQQLPTTEFAKFNSEITFDDVWFKYGDEWVLKGLSFTVPAGSTVALVGPTGAGKSTIAQLLPRLYDVQKGEIRIDGQPIKSFTQKSLRENMAFVPQRPFLFLDTVAANIAFGRPFSQENIQLAARNAHADEFICGLPEGYQTILAETGKNLSGGQQQRLAIARALVKQAPILIMDEATSSLDAVSEHHIKSALHNLRGKMTQIVIAHRLSTIEDADKIIYIERGQKVAEGTKAELLESCAGFKLMWHLLYNQSQNPSKTAC